MSYIRAGRKYNLGEVLQHVVKPDHPSGRKIFRNAEGAVTGRAKVRHDFDGDRMKVSSLRLYVFKEKGCDCVGCGAKGSYFAKEKSEGHVSYHMNLYAVKEDGSEVLMTKDHILPSSQGGKDTIENLQPMCVECNTKKGAKLPVDNLVTT